MRAASPVQSEMAVRDCMQHSTCRRVACNGSSVERALVRQRPRVRQLPSGMHRSSSVGARLQLDELLAEPIEFLSKTVMVRCRPSHRGHKPPCLMAHRIPDRLGPALRSSHEPRRWAEVHVADCAACHAPARFQRTAATDGSEYLLALSLIRANSCGGLSLVHSEAPSGCVG
jgi:hypothetical protein